MSKKLFISALAVMISAFAVNASYADDAAIEEAASAKEVPQQMAPMGEHQGPPPGGFMQGEGNGPQHFGAPPSQEDMSKKKAEFEKRLKLTDKQKKQIEEQKTQDREKIKPVFDELNAKKQEIRKLEDDKTLKQADREKQIEQLRKDTRDLNTKIRSAHEENMKNFESVLTKKQKKEFTKIKEEQKKEMEKQRKSFEQNQKNRPQGGFPPGPRPFSVEE